MSYHPDDMNKVQEWGELLPEDWYHIRIGKVEEGESKESSEPTVYLILIGQEEPYVGAHIPDNCSLQPHALAKLKAYYKATGKGMLPTGGHDPEQLKDGECWVRLTHQVYKGVTRGSVPPWGIKSLADGKPLK